MDTFYRIVHPLTPHPKVDLTRKEKYGSMTVEQLAAIINSTQLPVLGSTQSLVIPSTARKSAKAEWRRRHQKSTLFAVGWAQSAHKRSFGL